MPTTDLSRAVDPALGVRFDKPLIDAVPKDHAEALAWGFPDIVPYVQPLGSQIVVQLRRPSKTSASSLILRVEETRDAEQYKVQVARILLIGPGAFTNRTTGEPWPEVAMGGPKAGVGSFIRIPMAGLDRWFQKPLREDAQEAPVMLALIRDTDIKALWCADPLHVDTAMSGW